jgi:hypothetical protein
VTDFSLADGRLTISQLIRMSAGSLRTKTQKNNSAQENMVETENNGIIKTAVLRRIYAGSETGVAIKFTIIFEFREANTQARLEEHGKN